MKLRWSLLFVLCAIGASHALTPVQTYGHLKAKGGYLYDSTGSNKAVLRGMSMYWSSEPDGYNYYTSGTVQWLQSDFKASVIRVPLAPDPPDNSTNTGYLTSSADSVKAMARVTNMINACITQGLYVIVDWHCPGSTPYTDHAVAFYTYLVKKYGNLPNLIWEVWNEPTVDGGTISTHANTVIAAIRKAGNGGLVVVGTPSYSSEPNNSAMSIKDDSSNVAYTLHFYAGSSAHDSYRSNMTNAIAAGRTVFATEWGTTDYTGQTNYSSSNSTTWLNSYLEANYVSSCNWNIGTPRYPTAGTGTTVEASAAINYAANYFGGWDTTVASSGGNYLTQSGAFIRSWLRGKNSAFTVPPPPPDTALIPADTLYPAAWASKSGVDSATSTDGGSKKMITVTSGSWVQYLDTVTATSYFNVRVRVKSAAGGSIIFSNDSAALCTLSVPASSSWATLLDTLHLNIGYQTLRADFKLAGNVAWYKFGKLLWTPSTGVESQHRQATTGIVLHDNIVALQDGHAWRSMRMVDARGAVIQSWTLPSAASEVVLPRRAGMTWLLLKSEDGSVSQLAVLPTLR